MRQKEFFEDIAHRWDETAVHDKEKIKYCLDCAQIKTGDRILDVGTGTGILIPFLYNYAGREGKIDAVDYSSNMIDIARKKWKYDNTDFIYADINEYKCPHKYNIIVCYSVFPHFTDKEKILRKIYSMLEPKGKIIIFHSQSRDAINSLHKKAGDQVENDVLPEMQEVVYMLKKEGLGILKTIDNDDMYMIIGEKAENECT